jgi:hypothetical protein
VAELASATTINWTSPPPPSGILSVTLKSRLSPAV